MKLGGANSASLLPSWPYGNVRQREVPMWRAGIEHFCKGCQKTHSSTVWYYRRQFHQGNCEWLCGMKYLWLRHFDTTTWRMLVVRVRVASRIPAGKGLRFTRRGEIGFTFPQRPSRASCTNPRQIRKVGMVESTSADRGSPPLSMVQAKYAQSQSETSPQCCSLF